MNELARAVAEAREHYLIAKKQAEREWHRSPEANRLLVALATAETALSLHAQAVYDREEA